MTFEQLIFVALATLPTMVTVLIGILINSARLGDLGRRLDRLERIAGDILTKLADVEHRLTVLENGGTVKSRAS